MSDNISRILSRAADIVDQQPVLPKGSFSVSHGEQFSYCTMGAIRKAGGWWGVGIDPGNRDYVDALIRVAQTVNPDSGAHLFSVISVWNDDETRTKDDVVQALRTAAEL